MARSKGIREFQRLMRLREAGMADLYVSTIRDIKKKAILREVVRIIDQAPEAPNIDAIIDVLDLNRGRFAELATWIATSWKLGGDSFVDPLPPVRVPGDRRVKISFDVTNPRVEALIREQSGDLIREIVDEQRGVIQLATAQGFEQGQNPRRTGLDLVGRIDRRTGERVGGVVGLTRFQAGWAFEARIELALGTPESLRRYLARELRDKRFDRSVLAALRERNPIPLSDERIDKMATAYEQAVLRFRGNAIGRTETLSALNGGRAEGMEQVLERTRIDRKHATKNWDATGDARTRTTHNAAELQSPLPIDSLFRVGDYDMAYPGDRRRGGPEETINCRCALIQEIDFIAAAGGDPA